MHLKAAILMQFLLNIATINAQQQPKLILPIGHTEGVESAVFSQNGKLVATCSWDNKAKIWDVKHGALLADLTGHKAKINSVSFSNDGKKILTASDDGTAKIWDSRTGVLLRDLIGHTASVKSAKFSPNQKTVLTASLDGTATVWDNETDSILMDIQAHVNIDERLIGINSASFSNDGEKIITASGDGTVKIWNVSTGILLGVLNGHRESIISGYFSPDGKMVVTASYDSAAIVWDVTNGKLLRQLNHDGIVRSAQFNLDGSKVVTASDDGSAKIWDVKTGHVLFNLIAHTDAVNLAAFSHDGKKIVTASHDGTAKIWDVNSGKLLVTLKKHTSVVISATFSPDNTHVVTASYDDSSIIWDASSGNLIHALTGNASKIVETLYNPTRKEIITASRNGTAGVYSLADGRMRLNLNVQSSKIYSTALSSEGNKLVIGSDNGAVKLWDLQTGNLLSDLKHSGTINFSSFSPDGEKIATSSNDIFTGTTRIWNASGTLISELLGHKRGVHKAIFSPDGKTILTCSDATRVWDIKGNLLTEFPLHSSFSYAAAFSPSERKIASVSYYDSIAKVFDAKTGNLLLDLKGHTWGVHSIKFNADGTNIITTSGDWTTKIWNAKTGDLVNELIGHEGIVHSAYYAPDGKKILTISSDHTAKVWNSDDGTLLFDLLGHSGDVTSGEWIPETSFIVTSSTDARCIIWNAKNGEQILSLIPIDSADWVVTHPSGLFDGSAGAMDKLYFVQGLDIIDFAQLKERYYEPGLWKKVISGEKLRDVAMFNSIELPPDMETGEVNELGVSKLLFTNREGGIGQISVSVNGLEIIEDIRPSGFNPKQASWSHDLKLSNLSNLKKGEENLIEIRAWNEGHWVISRPLQLRYTPPTTKGATAVVMNPKTNKPYPSVYILSCGISDYTNNGIDLKYAAKDAESMANALELGAKKLFGADKSYIYTLTDNSAIKPSKVNIQKTFKEISSRSTPNDVFIVYLSGHGINYGGDNGDFYYLTNEAYSTDLQAYNDPVQRANATISSKELIELFKTVPSDKRVLMIDACASGKMVQNLVESRDISSSTLRALDRLRDRTGFHIITGCAADAVSYEASRFGQGVLTYSLIEAMKGASLKENKFIDVNQLFQYAKERVPVLAKGIGGIQSPQVFSPIGAQSFDIGELDEELKSKIPLSKTRPVYIRSQFQDEQKFRDVLGLSKKLDEALNETSAKGESAPLLFVDQNEFPEACQFVGRYQQTSVGITLTILKVCNGQESKLMLSGKTAQDLIQKILNSLD